MGKNKTPMCLINELSRFNDVQHQYHLVDESGPSHQKTFTVVLKLGEQEEYTASGSSIRKAQHAAAEKALAATKLPHPAPKIPKKGGRGNMPLTPTVELNVLAMKRGEPAIYEVYEPPRPPTTSISPFGPSSAVPMYDFRGMHNQRYHFPRGLYCATVNVGDKQFIGRGKTIQAARHAAAEEALKMIREQPLPAHRKLKEQLSDENIKSPISLVHELALKRNMVVKFEVVSESGPSHMPSFVTRCIVGDIVTESEGNGKKVSKRKAAEKMLEELKKLPPLPQSSDCSDTLDAKLLRKKNYPKKRRSNLIRKNDDSLSVEGSKEKTEDTFGSLQCETDKEETKDNSRRGSISDNSSLRLLHPVTRLIQIQQAKKEKEPEFRLVAERCVEKRKKEFVIECSVSNKKSVPPLVQATGSGSSKKIAKKEAAEAVLQLLGYSSKDDSANNVTHNQCSPPSILKNQPNVREISLSSNETSDQTQKVRKVKFVESTEIDDKQHHQLLAKGNIMKSSVNKYGRQLVPGLLLMPNVENPVEKNLLLNQSGIGSNTADEENYQRKISLSDCDILELAAVIAKELLETGVSQSAFQFLKQRNGSNGSTIDQLPGRITRPSLQLQYLSSVLGSSFQVHFSDFPKNNKLEYLSVVTITTNPPRVSHGLGTSVEASRDAAALQALKSLDLTLPNLSNLSINGC